MLRVFFTSLVAVMYVAAAQPASAYLLQADKLKSVSTLQSIILAKQAYTQAIKQKDAYNACLSGLFLSNAYRKLGDYDASVYFDSLAIQHSLQGQEIVLRQKALNSYIRNFVEQLLLSDAERLLEKDSLIFINYNTKETCLWYEMKALCSFNRFRFGEAIIQSKNAQAIAQLIQDTGAMMHAQMMVFKFQSILLQSNNMDRAYEALTYFEKKDNALYAAQAANIIGFAFETNHNTDKALEYYQRALRFNNALRNDNEAMQTRMHMADAFIGANMLDTAKNILCESLQYFTRKHIAKKIAFATIRLARIYISTEKYDSALVFLKVTDSLNKLLKHSVLTTGSNTYLALLQDKIGNFKERDSLANLVVNTIFRKDFKELLPVARQRLIDGEIGKFSNSVRKRAALSKKDFSVQIGDSVKNLFVFERAKHFNWQTGASSIYDSTFTEKQSYIQVRADNEYKLDNYKDTIRSAKNETVGERQWSSKLESTVVIVGIFLLMLAAGLWVQYKNRRRAERDKAQIEELQKEIHHRVTNNLGVINAMVEMAGKASANQMPMSTLKTRIDSIALVHRLLYSGTAATGKIALQFYFESLSTAIAAIFERDNKVKITVDAPVETDSVIAEKLGLIVNELITNTFKYAFAEKENATIHLYARQQKNELCLTVACLVLK